MDAAAIRGSEPSICSERRPEHVELRDGYLKGGDTGDYLLVEAIVGGIMFIPFVLFGMVLTLFFLKSGLVHRLQSLT